MHGTLALVTAALLVGCAASYRARGAEEPGPGAELVYRLEAREEYGAGEPVRLVFSLENRSQRAAWVLKWYTPLEGVRGRIFSVARDGHPVDYEGPMYKRADPQRGDYVRIEAGRRETAEVDLSTVYDLKAPGEYRVEFAGRLHDVAWDEAAVPRRRDQHRGVDVSGNAVSFRVRPG